MPAHTLSEPRLSGHCDIIAVETDAERDLRPASQEPDSTADSESCSRLTALRTVCKP